MRSPHSMTAEQAQPSAGRFISVSLDKPAGHHSIGTHILLMGKKKKTKPDEAVLSFLHWKKTGHLNEHELLLPIPFLALRRCICLDFFFSFSGNSPVFICRQGQMLTLWNGPQSCQVTVNGTSTH